MDPPFFWRDIVVRYVVDGGERRLKYVHMLTFHPLQFLPRLVVITFRPMSTIGAQRHYEDERKDDETDEMA